MPKTDVWFDPSRYATVAERIALFYRSHPNGRILTELVNRDAESVTFKALVFRGDGDTVPAATGWATEREGDGDINTVACLENTETSAIGRALANLGYTASKERPSVEEMRKAARTRERRKSAAVSTATHATAQATAHAAVQANTVGESSPTYGHAVEDILDLLREAERAGLKRVRADRLRTRLEQGPPLLAGRLLEIERSLRKWLEQR
ncbi:MAG TPA: hypothetical protein VLI40_12845 [Gemmatimonadaceae bacterium]|nr:hypothetical protein [Gemmatimonadaceae bacterium]